MDNGKIAGDNQYVVFKLGAEVFGVEINKVKEIIVYQATTFIPGAGHRIEGVINLRGSVIPIFSLHKRFGFSEGDNNRNRRIVVVEAHESIVGLVVDGVSEVLMISEGAVEQPSEMITPGVEASHISGIAKIGEQLILLLDLDRVIDGKVAQAV